MTNPPQLNIRVAAELKEAFIQKAKEDGTTATDLIVGFMKQYLEIESVNTTLVAVVDSGAIQTQISELEKRLSDRMAALEEAAEGGLREEVERLKAELAEVTAELEDCQEARNDFFANGLAYLRQIQELEGNLLTPENRDRVLAALGVGKQAAQYKRVKAELDKLMS
jgi:seryl-tRNA synthetase